MTDKNTRASLQPSVVEALKTALLDLGRHKAWFAAAPTTAELLEPTAEYELDWIAERATELAEHPALEALAASPRDDVRELLREARDFLLDTQGTDSVGHRLALRIDTALAPTTQGTDGGLADGPSVMDKAVERAAKYDELIFAVGNVWPNETRHETALRYIRQAEQSDNSEASAEGTKP